MADQPHIAAVEWQLIMQLLERERGDIPVEIHHSGNAETREHLRQRLHVVDELITKVKSATGQITKEASMSR